MFGENPILAPEKGDGTTLKVHSIFPTFQGEGPYTGHPATFIRLSGCNLACDFCDTDFDEFEEISVETIIEKIKSYSKELVVITGGEPFRQPIGLLCEKLLEAGFKVQIESNGTIYREIPETVEIVCSPKNTGKGYSSIRPDVLKHTIAIKFIVSNTDDNYKSIAEVGQTDFNIPVYVQPMDEYNDEKNKANKDLALALANENNAVISLQMHKLLEIE